MLTGGPGRNVCYKRDPLFGSSGARQLLLLAVEQCFSGREMIEISVPESL
jgi:hypothetical protein